MSDKRQETIADIVAEMRKDIAEGTAILARRKNSPSGTRNSATPIVHEKRAAAIAHCATLCVVDLHGCRCRMKL